MTERTGLVLFGDVGGSRVDGRRASAWLRTLTLELDRHYGERRLAPFGFTQGDEIQGLLKRDADPIAAVLRATLHPHAMPMRWVVVAGGVEPGRGPATQRTGAAFIDARGLVERARRKREGLLVTTGDATSDALLADIAPTLAVLLADLTTRQRVVARLILIDGLRQAEAAKRLDVSRPTVSVAAERARVREIERLAHAVAVLIRNGSLKATDGGGTE
jgi:predicted DNA-binding protein (UPF0251 family)